MIKNIGKFLHSKDVGFYFDKQIIKISSKEFFRRKYRELEGGDEFINDPMEGTSIWSQHVDINTDTASEKELYPIGKMLGSAPPSGSNNEFSGNVMMTETADFHMMCFTTLHPEISKEIFCRRHDTFNDPYDACISFNDVENLVRHIIDRALFRDKNGKFSIPVGELFWEIACRDVIYSQRSVGWSDPEPNTTRFHKDISFRHQKEYRIIFQGSANLSEELYAFVPGLREFIHLVDLSQN